MKNFLAHSIKIFFELQCQILIKKWSLGIGTDIINSFCECWKLNSSVSIQSLIFCAFKIWSSLSFPNILFRLFLHIPDKREHDYNFSWRQGRNQVVLPLHLSSIRFDKFFRCSLHLCIQYWFELRLFCVRRILWVVLRCTYSKTMIQLGQELQFLKV